MPGLKGRTGPKHKTELDREKTREEVARLQAFGLSPRQISERLGKRISHVTVWRYLNEVGERYKKSQLASRETYVAEKLEQIRLLRVEAHEAWERSKTSDDPEVTKNGDATFLRVIAELLRDERELLGLDAPTKQDVRAAVVSAEVRQADFAALRGRPPRSDVVAEVVEAEAKALPAHEPGRNGTNGKPKEK